MEKANSLLSKQGTRYVELRRTVKRHKRRFIGGRRLRVKWQLIYCRFVVHARRAQRPLVVSSAFLTLFPIRLEPIAFAMMRTPLVATFLCVLVCTQASPVRVTTYSAPYENLVATRHAQVVTMAWPHVRPEIR